MSWLMEFMFTCIHYNPISKHFKLDKGIQRDLWCKAQLFMKPFIGETHTHTHTAMASLAVSSTDFNLL